METETPHAVERAHQLADQRTLIERARRGDASAHRALYETHVDRIYRLTFRITGQEHVARELTQDTFVRAFAGIESFRGDSAFGTWLHTIFHVTTMCRVLEVSKAGYYAWRARPLGERVQSNRVLADRIKEIHEASRGRYGSPRVHGALRNEGCRCAPKRVARLMRENGLRATPKRAFRVATNSQHEDPIAPNHLQRQFAVGTVAAVNRVWGADITYIPTGAGWLYLAIVLDLKSRRVVGWALRITLQQELVLAALRMALQHRGARGMLHIPIEASSMRAMPTRRSSRRPAAR